jgi:hypothetical protein
LQCWFSGCKCDNASGSGRPTVRASLGRPRRLRDGHPCRPLWGPAPPEWFAAVGTPASHSQESVSSSRRHCKQAGEKEGTWMAATNARPAGSSAASASSRIQWCTVPTSSSLARATDCLAGGWLAVSMQHLRHAVSGNRFSWPRWWTVCARRRSAGSGLCCTSFHCGVDFENRTGTTFDGSGTCFDGFSIVFLYIACPRHTSTAQKHVANSLHGMRV